jgi:hypothetical protein
MLTLTGEAPSLDASGRSLAFKLRSNPRTKIRGGVNYFNLYHLIILTVIAEWAVSVCIAADYWYNYCDYSYHSHWHCRVGIGRVHYGR